MLNESIFFFLSSSCSCSCWWQWKQCFVCSCDVRGGMENALSGQFGLRVPYVNKLSSNVNILHSLANSRSQWFCLQCHAYAHTYKNVAFVLFFLLPPLPFIHDNYYHFFFLLFVPVASDEKNAMMNNSSVTLCWQLDRFRHYIPFVCMMYVVCRVICFHSGTIRLRTDGFQSHPFRLHGLFSKWYGIESNDAEEENDKVQ